MTQQYVGPYFVPHGWTAWSNNVQYDPLYVVSYNLAWYILAQPAPVGTEPTQDGGVYWKQVDNWQGQLTNIVDEINGIEGNITSIENSVNNLSDFVHSLPMSKRKILMLGDSYIARTDKNFAYYTNQYLGYDNVLSFGIPGYKLSQIDDIMNAFISNNPGVAETITDLCILMGANDIAEPPSPSQAYLYLANVKTKFPNAIIWGGFPGINKSLSGALYINTSFLYMNAFLERGFKWIPNLSVNLFNPDSLESDSVHPNEKGHQKLARALVNGLQGQPYYLWDDFNINIQNGNLRYTYNNKNLNLMITLSNIIISESSVFEINLPLPSVPAQNFGAYGIVYANLTTYYAALVSAERFKYTFSTNGNITGTFNFTSNINMTAMPA